jgi:hypothetical protein
MNGKLLFALIFVFICTAFSAEGLAYTYTEIVAPGLTAPVATAINNRGDIVGYSNVPENGVSFLDSGGIFTILSFPGSTRTQAHGINDAGDIVGQYIDTAGAHGFKYNYNSGVWTTIDPPDPAVPLTVTLTAINNLGQIAGTATTRIPGSRATVTDGFVDTAGTFSFAPTGSISGFTIAGLNDSGEVVGSYEQIQLPSVAAYGRVNSWSTNSSSAGFSAVNDGGQVLGGGYLLSNGAQTTPGTPIVYPGAAQTLPFGLNNAGDIVGGWRDSAGQFHAFLAVASAPECIVSISAGPPRQMSFSVQDNSGLAQIAVTNSFNATTNIPTFIAGTTSPVLVTSETTDPAHSASATLAAANTSSASSSCSASIAGETPVWFGLGGVLTSSVGLGSSSNGSLDAYGLGSDSSLWHITQTGPSGPWGLWSGLGGGGLAGEPAVITDSAGQTEILVVLSDGSLWQISQTSPGDWSGAAWQNIASGVKGRPAVIRNGNGQLQAFVRAADDSVIAETQSSPGSAAWAAVSLGGVITSNPAAALSGNTARVVAIGTDQALWTTSVSSDGTITPWSSAGGGSLRGDPAAAVSEGLFYVFARGTDNAVWFNWCPSGSCVWQSLGGEIVNNPTVIANSDGRLEVFAAGTDNAVWHTAQIATAGSQWSGWSTLGGVIFGDVTPALDSSGAVNLFVIGSDSGLWYMTQSAPGSWQ